MFRIRLLVPSTVPDSLATRHKFAVSTSSYMRWVSESTYTFANSDCCLQEELAAIVQLYERRGHFDEVLTLLEAGLSLERAHVSPSLLSENLS